MRDGLLFILIMTAFTGIAAVVDACCISTRRMKEAIRLGNEAVARRGGCVDPEWCEHIDAIKPCGRCRPR